MVHKHLYKHTIILFESLFKQVVAEETGAPIGKPLYLLCGCLSAPGTGRHCVALGMSGSSGPIDMSTSPVYWDTVKIP